MFTFPVAKFCQILKKHLGKELCPGQDLNPGPLAYEASVLPFCHGHFIVNLLKVEKLFQFLFTLPVAKNCQKNHATFLLSFASSTLECGNWHFFCEPVKVGIHVFYGPKKQGSTELLNSFLKWLCFSFFTNRSVSRMYDPAQGMLEE